MQTVALRDLQQKGLRAIPSSDALCLLESRSGPSYFLIRAEPKNLEAQRQELERSLALANLHNWQQRATELGLQDMSLEEINREIQSTRRKSS